MCPLAGAFFAGVFMGGVVRLVDLMTGQRTSIFVYLIVGGLAGLSARPLWRMRGAA